MDLRHLIPCLILGLACHDSSPASTTPPSTGTPAVTDASSPDATLEEGLILHFEKLSLGNEPEANRRWQLTTDGVLLFSKNQPPVPRGTVYNTELKEVRRLDAQDIAHLLQTARDAGFWTGPRHLLNDSVEDGVRLRLTIRDGDTVGQLVVDNGDSAAVQLVEDLLTTAP